MNAADDIHKYFFIVFQRKYRLMFQVNPLLGKGFHMINQALFSLKDKSKKHVLFAAILLGTLRVNGGTLNVL